jgi:hypothetical protein
MNKDMRLKRFEQINENDDDNFSGIMASHFAGDDDFDYNPPPTRMNLELKQKVKKENQLRMIKHYCEEQLKTAEEKEREILIHILDILK